MVPFWPSLIEDSAEKGWVDGADLAPYSPIMQWGVLPDVDDAYRSSYFLAMALVYK